MIPTLAVVLAVSTSDAAAVEAGLAHWQATAGEMKSLHVEWTHTETDTRLNRERKYEHTLRLLRTDDNVLGSVDIRQQGESVKRFVLRDGAITEIDPTRKTLIRYKPADARRFALDNLHPFLVALDRDRLAKTYTAGVEKRDDLYTYFSLTPKEGKSDWPAGKAAVVRRKNDILPVGVPAALWYEFVGLTVRWDITKWVLNGDAPPKAEEFELPSAKGGWKMAEFPLTWKTGDERLKGK